MGNEFTEKNFYQSTSKNLNINENIKKKMSKWVAKDIQPFLWFSREL